MGAAGRPSTRECTKQVRLYPKFVKCVHCRNGRYGNPCLNALPGVPPPPSDDAPPPVLLGIRQRVPAQRYDDQFATELLAYNEQGNKSRARRYVQRPTFEAGKRGGTVNYTSSIPSQTSLNCFPLSNMFTSGWHFPCLIQSVMHAWDLCVLSYDSCDEPNSHLLLLLLFF
jgi:hypothetical protein